MVLCTSRYKQSAKQIHYGCHNDLKAKVSQGYQLSEIVAAMKDDLVLLILYHWEKLQYQATFILTDLASCRIIGSFESPMPNMSIMECKISADGSCVAVLFYFRQKDALPFEYDVYLFSTETFKLLDIIPCNSEVRPYVSFDPRFKSSRIAIVNYSKKDGDIKNGLVLYCWQTHQIIAVSHVMLSIIYGGGYFCVNYSRDGSFLILQKISDNMNGVHCYADSYVFDSNHLKLLKHYFANLQAFSTLCDTNYAPLFSCCSSRMCITSEEYNGEQRRLQVSIYQLPRPISLQEQCRIVILQTVKRMDAVVKLPLPPRLKDFLQFTPEML